MQPREVLLDEPLDYFFVDFILPDIALVVKSYGLKHKIIVQEEIFYLYLLDVVEALHGVC